MPVQIIGNLDRHVDASKRETWKPVPSLPSYEASTLGDIRSVAIQGRARRSPHILKPQTSENDRYLRIKPGSRNKTVHRLVCEAFHGPCPPDKTDAHHLDGNPRNNAPSNLCWVTRKENQVAASKAGKWRSHSSLSEPAVRAIRLMHEAGAKQTELARWFGVKYSTINGIVNRRTWAYLPAPDSNAKFTIKAVPVV